MEKDKDVSIESQESVLADTTEEQAVEVSKKLDWLVQIDDSELPQSVKDHFRSHQE